MKIEELAEIVKEIVNIVDWNFSDGEVSTILDDKYKLTFIKRKLTSSFLIISECHVLDIEKNYTINIEGEDLKHEMYDFIIESYKNKMEQKFVKFIKKYPRRKKLNLLKDN